MLDFMPPPSDRKRRKGQDDEGDDKITEDGDDKEVRCDKER